MSAPTLTPPVAPVTPVPAALPNVLPATNQRLYETVLAALTPPLRAAALSLPTHKRLAWLLTGLIASPAAQLGALAQTLHNLTITPAKEESIAQRLRRTLADPRFDPDRLLPPLLTALLPVVLADVLAAHRANAASGPRHHARFRPLWLVVDESSHTDKVHLLVIGLAYQGMVLPLAVRCWPQNQKLPPGQYAHWLRDALFEAQAVLPAELRDHVLLLADRGYDPARLIDLCRVFDWAWVLRVQGQTRLQLPDGTECPLRSLVAKPGQSWFSATSEADLAAPEPALRLCKKAGWREARVAVVWAEGAKEPWLLVTSLTGAAERALDYARRWFIERLFLGWKSHGWDLEGSGVHDPVRLGRLLAALVFATWWRVAIGLPVVGAQLAELAQRAGQRGPGTAEYQLRLPFDERPSRTWAAKFSLLTWCAKVVAGLNLKTATPELRWTFPAWDAPTWSEQCQQAYAA